MQELTKKESTRMMDYITALGYDVDSLEWFNDLNNDTTYIMRFKCPHGSGVVSVVYARGCKEIYHTVAKLSKPLIK